MAADLPVFIQNGFELRGHQSYGEAITQSQHMLQCAHMATEAGEDEPMIIAALLHDFGHLIDKAGDATELRIDAEHETIGAAYLSNFFPETVTRPISLHVAAKRYLCLAETGYQDRLSDASRLSLQLQGGPFSPQQAEIFEEDAFSAQAIRLRHYDELAKKVGAVTPPLEFYSTMLRRHMFAGV